VITYEHIEWCDIWVTGAPDNTLPRVLLVGDSIARSYFAKVEEELKGAFRCARLTTSRCVSDPAIDKELALVLDDYRFAVVHLNNGLHGWDYDEASYAEGLGRTLDFIIARSPQSRLICATTTAMRRKDDLTVFDAKTDRVRERNRMMRDLARERKLSINDLYGSTHDRPDLSSADGVHFNPEGQAFLGTQVSRAVQAV
jgi:hypothetical protein